jgi:hypothetical protein
MKSPVLILIVLLALPAICPLPAAPLTHELSRDLTYVRATALPADLPGQMDLRACVLDLRYATGDEAAAVALAGWLKFHASARTPVFIIANAATAAALLDVLPPRALPAGTLTLGLPGPGFTPDIAIKTDADTERRAYDAFAPVNPSAALVDENDGKIRYDEAAMVRELAAGATPADHEPAPEINPAAPAAPAPLIDRTLQRAVHVHRGLATLKLLRG